MENLITTTKRTTFVVLGDPFPDLKSAHRERNLRQAVSHGTCRQCASACLPVLPLRVRLAFSGPMAMLTNEQTTNKADDDISWQR